MRVQLVLQPCQFGLGHLLFLLAELPSERVVTDIVAHEDGCDHHGIIENRPHHTKLVESDPDGGVGQVGVVDGKDMLVPQQDEKQIDNPEGALLHLASLFKEIGNKQVEVRHEDGKEQEQHEGIDAHRLLGGTDIMFEQHNDQRPDGDEQRIDTHLYAQDGQVAAAQAELLYLLHCLHAAKIIF